MSNTPRPKINWKLIAVIATLLFMVGARLFEASRPSLSNLLYLLGYVSGGIFGLRAGFRSLREWKIDIDLLMVLAAAGAAVVGEYFEGTLLLFLFSLSNVLQDLALDKTRDAIRRLMDLRPQTAELLQEGRSVVVPVEQVEIGAHFLVRPGGRIALDGRVIAGESVVDRSIITGESRPSPVGPGEPVFAGTINVNGSLTIEAHSRSDNSTLATVIDLVERAREEKTKAQHFLDRAERYYAGIVILGTIIAAVVPLFLGQSFETAFYRAMTLMVAASPCALIISTPVTVWSAIGSGARRGILYKGGLYLERTADVRVVAFDKTGTLTHGDLRLRDILPIPASWNRGAGTVPDAPEQSTEQLLAIAASVEDRSEHVLAKAVIEEAQRRGAAISEALAFESVAGRGVQATVGERLIRIGNLRFFRELETPAYEQTKREVDRLEALNRTVVVIGAIEEKRIGILLGILIYDDIIRDEAAQVIERLKREGIERVVALSGDNQSATNSVAATVGIEEVYAGLLPEQKLEVIERLEQTVGPVAMIGDGVNDAPALARASVGIAMGATGTDIARETADVVLLPNSLHGIPDIFALGRRTRRTLIFNLGIASLLIVGMIAIILFGTLPLPLAVIGHEGSTVLVSMNGLRLFFYGRRAGGR